MDIAIVTGASSSLGLAISQRLIQLGFRVYGLGGDYTDCPLRNVNFRPYTCDLADPVALEEACRAILAEEKGVYVVVNNAKFFGRSPFLEMDAREMEQILRINLLCPLLLARSLAGSLKALQGYFIQLGPPNADASRGGPAGAAASGGLKWMGDALFHELRQDGVRVCHLSPEPNRTREGRQSARPGARTEAAIDPEAVAQAIEQILQSPFGNIITELVLRPLRVQEPDQDPVVRLPYPEPKPVPYTVPREVIEAEEQLEEEEFVRSQREKKERRRSRHTKDAAQQPSAKAAKGPVSEDSSKSAKATQAAEPAKAAEPAPAREHLKPSTDSNDASAPPRSGRRRSRRKPRPPRPEVGFIDRVKPAEAAEPAKAAPEPRPEPTQAPAAAPKKAAPKKTAAKKATTKKTAAKKAAKKAVKKAAAKKAPAKKATKKAVKKAATKKAPSRKKASPAKEAAGDKESS